MCDPPWVCCCLYRKSEECRINYFRDDQLVQQAISDMEKLMEARQKSKEQERSSTKKSVLDALRSLKTKKQEQPAQEQDKPKKAKKKGIHRRALFFTRVEPL